MTEQTVFESTLIDNCIYNHIESAFGIEARNVSEIHPEFWGLMIHITFGPYQGWYDVHSDDDERNYYFISA